MSARASPDDFLSWRQVQAMVGVSRSTWWRMRQRGEAPDPEPISPRRKGYRRRIIEEWSRSPHTWRKPKGGRRK